MFAWGEDYRQSFRLKKGSSVPAADGVQLFNFSFHIADLSAGHRVLAFIKANGDVSVIRTNEGADGRRVAGKQKFVVCKQKIEAVSCGDDVVTLLSEKGTVFCVDTTSSPYTPRSPEALCNIQVAQVACGSQHTLALTKGGQVYAWGQDSRGQLGLGKRNSGAGSPQQLRSLSAIPLVQIAAGGEQSLALSVSGGVFGWGRNDCGQLGLGDTEDRHTPAPVHCMSMKKTVNISCGKEHAAFLTKDGVVFTCGSGRYGQLGHNSLQDELRPRLVVELWGAKVTKTACGRYHTLVLTDSMKVYSFGCDEQEQLGRGEENHPSVPLLVQMPQGTPDGQLIKNIYAGGDGSFATCMPNEEIPVGSNSGPNKATLQPIENMIDRWISECDSKSGKKTKQEIHKIFSSASFVNRSFLDYRKDKHFQTSPNYSGLDLSLAHRVFKKLVGKDGVLAEVEAAVVQLLSSFDKKPVGVEGLRVFLILNELLCVMQKKQKPITKLAEEIAATVQKLPAENFQTLGNWWSSLLPSTMEKHVKVWKTALSAVMSSVPIPRSSVRNILLILQNMYIANRKTEIPEKTFCCQIDQRFLQEELQLWRSMLKINGNQRRKDVQDSPLLLCSRTFLMDLKSKKLVFDNNAAWTQKEHQNQKMVFMWPFGWVPQPGSGPAFFELSLRRASLLEDAFIQLSTAHQCDFKKPLVVYFDGDTKVTDVYKRDFFHHLFHNFLETKSEMFMFNDSKTLTWFSSRATEEDRSNFYRLGFLCGLALYNSSIVHLSFPLALFKKLLDVEPTLEDMLEFSPVVGQSLQYTVNYEDDDLENEYMEFSINWDKTDVELDPQNPGKPVTSRNKEEFVDAYINYAFNTSVESTFQEFKRGFFQVCDRDPVKLFQPEELRGVLVGQDVYEWAKLKQNTCYDRGFYPGHPTVQMFWEVFEELTEEQKKDFLWFLTGFRRAPVLGIGEMRMVVRDKLVLSGSHDHHFPESLTCHSILELPVYSTKEIMRDRLTEALNPESGFLK